MTNKTIRQLIVCPCGMKQLIEAKIAIPEKTILAAGGIKKGKTYFYPDCRLKTCKHK